MGRNEKELQGILGALGNRVNGTPGYGVTHEPGISMILHIDETQDVGWRYRLKPVMIEALEIHAPSWLPRRFRLLRFFRSRFPGWLGFEDPRFNGGPLDEVGYKLATREKAQAALSREALSGLLAGGQVHDVIERLVLIGKDTNLLFQPHSQIGDLRLLHHDGLDRTGFCHAFVDLLYGEGETPDRLDRYVAWVSSQGLDPMNRWTLPTFFLFFLHPDSEIFVKPTATRNLMKLGGWNIRFDPKPTGADYARIRDAYRELREELAEYGPRHMIDVQSFGWVVHEEAERQRKAREAAEDEGVDLDPAVELAMTAFERNADANHLIRQADRIVQAQLRFRRDLGTEAKLRSLEADTFVDFLAEVDAHGGDKGLFGLGIPYTKDPARDSFRLLQEDLSALRTALAELLHGTGTRAERVDAAWTRGKSVRNYISEGLTIPSALLFVQDPETSSGILSMSKREEKLDKLRKAEQLPPSQGEATLGARLDEFETTLTGLPARYGRAWIPEVRKQFYFSESFEQLDLSRPLPPPPSPPPPPPPVTFGEIVQGLQDEGLHFSRESVANYVLALQTKRFAILTGISGTGKTRIAREVARRFQTPAQGHALTSPDDAFEVKAVTTNIKHGVIQLPVRIGRILRLPPMKPDSDRGRIRVKYANADTTLSFREHPKPGNVRLHPRGTFGEWFRDNLRPGDSYWIRVLDDEAGDHDRLEIGLPKMSPVERQSTNYELVPVRPDWVDNRGLLGYLNPLTNEYTTTPFLSLILDAQTEVDRAERDERKPHPFFVVLDEMNLARVEHYFSDFLSALESEEPIPLHQSSEVEEVPQQLRMPNNVFFTGTVNVDETTYMFSPKVLDRAFTIEFDRVDLDGYTTATGSDEEEGLTLDRDDGPLRLTPYRKPGRKDWVSFSKLEGGRYLRTLLDLHAILEAEHRHFGYRVANEVARFVNLAHEQSADPRAAEHAFDLALLQKVLPKFHGTQQELEDLLKRLFSFAIYGRGRSLQRSGAVKLDEWSVEDGRLTPKRQGEPAPEADADGGGPSDESGPGEPGASKSDTGGPEAADAEPASDGAVTAHGDGPTPAFPRTGAKIWRMLRRLEQRGFTSFIE